MSKLTQGKGSAWRTTDYKAYRSRWPANMNGGKQPCREAYKIVGARTCRVSLTNKCQLTSVPSEP